MTDHIFLKTQTPKKKTSSLKLDRILGFLALVTIIAAWVVGCWLETSGIEPSLAQAMPVADHFAQLSTDSYVAYADSQEKQLIGYIAVAEANGYGGPLKMAVAIDSDGNIAGMAHQGGGKWIYGVVDRQNLC